MIHEIYSSFYKAAKDKWTWILLLICGLLLALDATATCRSLMSYDRAWYTPIDPRGLLHLAMYTSAVFTHMVITREKQSGSWRNKTTVGVKRHEIYIGSLLTTSVFSILALITSLLSFKAIVKLFGRIGRKAYTPVNIKGVILILFWMLAFNALYVLINTYFSSRLFCIVLSLVMFVAFSAVGTQCRDRLDVPYKVLKTDELTGEEYYEENPLYVTGTPRKILTYIEERSPEYVFEGKVTKHIFKIHRETTVCLILISSAAGILSFGRKELI